MKDNYFNAWLYLPPIIFTIIYCTLEGWWNFGIIFLAYLIWPFLVLGLIFLTEPIKYRFKEKNDEKKLTNRILSALNISKNQWNEFSDLKRKISKVLFQIRKTQKRCNS